MNIRRLAAVCAAISLLCTYSLMAAETNLDCPAPFGGHYGYPPPGLYETTLVSDYGDEIGSVKVWNNADKELKFLLTPFDNIQFTDIQIWTGNDIDELTTKKGKPVFKDFTVVDQPELDVGAIYEATINLETEFDFKWHGESHRWGFMLHGDYLQYEGLEVIDGTGFWSKGLCSLPVSDQYQFSRILVFHPLRGHFIDSPVGGLSYQGPTQKGVISLDDPDGKSGFLFFPDEPIEFAIDETILGTASAAKKVSPLDLFVGADINDPRVVNVARTLQTLDEDSGAISRDGKIIILPHVAACFSGIAGDSVDWADSTLVGNLLTQAVAECSSDGALLSLVSEAEAQGNLEAGLNASGIFRKNISKTADLGETKQKLEVMPVYFPGLRSNGDPSLCKDEDGDKLYDEGVDQLGVPYEEWRINGIVDGLECDPRIEDNDGDGAPDECVLTLIECREIAKPIVVNYLAKVDIFDDQVKEEFWPGRFSWDVFTAISRDDGATWKRMNNSRMADMSSFDLETGEPFPGTAGTPYLKVNDNKILTVWQSKFCKSGNPRYSINLCDNPDTLEGPTVDSETGEVVCEEYCRGNPDQETEVCEPDYPGDDDYFVTDIWGVRGQQGSVDYDEVDDVAELGIGEIPYSCLWAQRGVIASQKDITDGVFASMGIEDDPLTDVTQCTAEGVPFECCTGEGTGSCDESAAVELGDIVWFKPERITSGRRDAYLPVIGSARGAGFAIAWQEDPSGLRPGKGKGPGEGWSGAISNHKTDIWYSFISYDDFNIVDEDFESRGPGGGTDAEPDGDEGYLDKPGLGRPKALVPFSLPVRITDNDMVNTHTLKVEESSNCITPVNGTEPVCFPTVVDGTFVPVDPEEIAKEFCGHPEADPASCCDPDNHEGDPNCEDLKGFFGNMTGTKRYAYMARDIDEVDNSTGLYTGGDGVPDYQYYMDRGGTLDLCDLSGANSYMDVLPGTSAHERWFGFANAAGASKLVCVASDGRLIDGDVFASRPMLQLQPYCKQWTDSTKTTCLEKSAWALLAYEESKGLGHSLAAAEHEDTDNPVDEIIGEAADDAGQEKPIKQDIGKNMMYHSFDFAEPDLVDPGHIVNLPALCGGLYPTYCDDPKTPDVIETDEDNPTCSCTAGQPVPLYFDYYVENEDGIGEWLPDDQYFLQYRTEIARRARFLMQSPGKVVKPQDGGTNTLGAIIYKQGQEGQGRPADVFIRRFVKKGSGNPYKFENIECSTYLRDTFTLPACPNGAGDKDSAVGYNCNVWGEATGDLLCGGTFLSGGDTGYPRRDHINLTSADIDLAVDAGPDDDTPDDPTDDRYGTNKVLLWSQHERNLGDESYGLVNEDGTPCDVLNGEVCPAMYSNARSHRGFIRGDLLVTAYSLSPNWAAGRNGNDRYNFYVRRSFDGGQTWTTDPAGSGVYVCPEYRSDPNNPDPDGSGNLPPAVFDESCGAFEGVVPDGDLPPMPVGIAMANYLDYVPGTSMPEGILPSIHIGPGLFEPARNVSELKNNHVSSGDPRLGTTPPTYPLDGRDAALPILRFVEDEYVDNMFFVAWGTVDNAKSTGSTGVKAEAGPLDMFYTRTEDYGDNYLKIPWVIGGENSNLGFGETVWRYDFLAKGEPEEQGEAQLRATSDGSKAYMIWHSQISEEADPDEVYTRFYPWKPSVSYENDLWFRRVIFWPDAETPLP